MIGTPLAMRGWNTQSITHLNHQHMKKILSATAFASLFMLAACNTNAIKEKDAAILAQQRTIDSMNKEIARKQVIDSMNEVAHMQYALSASLVNASQAAQQAKQAPKVVYVNRTKKRSYAGRTQQASSSYSAPAAQPVVYQQAPVQQKKGWSAKAKGAVIGAGTGAIAGAVINGRNRAAGAVIGGVLGAGAGTGIGAIIDRKNGR